MKYQWKRQMDKMPHVPAQVIGEELSRLEEQNGGRIDPPSVVKAAKPKKSPLHPCFEWDNNAAAKAYRENQARELMRKIVVVYKEPGKEIQHIRAFVNIKTEDESYYCHTKRII